MNEDYSSHAAERQTDVAASRRRRGDALGPPPYGWRIASRERGDAVTWERDPEQDPERVLAAYRATGSLHGAARALNGAAVPGPTGGQWYSGSVGRILTREYPDDFDVRHRTPRVAAASPSDAERVPLFRRLLRCHCGGLLTPTRQQDGSYSYRCNAGYAEPITGTGARRRSIRPGHPDGITVSERVIRNWAETEAAKWDQLAIETEAAVESGIDRDALAAERERLTLAWTRGRLGDAVYEAEVERIEALLATAVDTREARRFLRLARGVNWDAPAPEVARRIARLWSAIRLDEHLRPVSADWRVAPPVPDHD